MARIILDILLSFIMVFVEKPGPAFSGLGSEIYKIIYFFVVVSLASVLPVPKVNGTLLTAGDTLI